MFLGLLAAGLGGCRETASSAGNEGSSGGTPAGDPVPFSHYAAELSDAECEWVTPCCAELGLPIAKTDCSTVVEAEHTEEYASADPAYTYDPELAGDCLVATREFYDRVGCEFAFAPAGIDTSALDVCNTVFQGMLEPGAPCTVDVECAGPPGEGAFCAQVGMEPEVTVCIIERRAAEGEACTMTCTDASSGDRSCSDTGSDEAPLVRGICYTDDRLYCADGVCQQQQPLRAPCTTDATCAEGYCSAAGECSAAKNEGEPCGANSQCGEGLYCEGLGCAPKKANGNACTSDGECQTNRCDDYECAELIEIALFCAGVSRQQ